MSISIIDTGFYKGIAHKYTFSIQRWLKFPSLVFLVNPQVMVSEHLVLKHMNFLMRNHHYQVQRHYYQQLNFAVNLFLRFSYPSFVSPAPVVPTTLFPLQVDVKEKMSHLSEMSLPDQIPNLFYHSLTSQFYRTALTPPGREEIAGYNQSLYWKSGPVYRFLQAAKISNLNMPVNAVWRLMIGERAPGATALPVTMTGAFYPTVSSVPLNYLKTTTHWSHPESTSGTSSISSTVSTTNTISTINTIGTIGLIRPIIPIRPIGLISHISPISTINPRIKESPGDDIGPRVLRVARGPRDPRNFFQAKPGAALHYSTPPGYTVNAARQSVAPSSAVPGESLEQVTGFRGKTTSGKESPASHPPEISKTPAVDLGYLTQQVYRMLEKKIKIERERRGW